MQFWEENKKLIVCVGIALVGLVVMFPSLLGTGPVIWSFHRDAYGRAMNDIGRLRGSLKRLYPRSGELMRNVSSAIEKRNAELREEKDALIKVMTFARPKPFRVEDYVTHKGARALRILSQALTNRQRYASVRGVELGDNAVHLGFEKEVQQGRLDATDEKEITRWLLRLAAVDDLVKAAVDARVMSIQSVAKLPVFERGAILLEKPAKEGDPKSKPEYSFLPLFIRCYPVHMKIFCSLDSLTRFVHGLEGLQGKVIDYKRVEDEKGRKHALVTFDIGTEDGLSKESSDIEAMPQFNIYGNQPHDDDSFIFKGRTYKLVDLKKDRSTWEPSEAVADLDPKDQPKARIKKGDNVSSRFFTVLDMGIVSHEPVEGRGPEQSEPPKLEVDIWVAAVDFFASDTPAPKKRPSRGADDKDDDKGPKKPIRTGF